MGLFEKLKEAKKVAASLSAEGRSGHQTAGPRPGGMMAGFANVMAAMVAPMLALTKPERGRVLPATEPAALEFGDAAALAAGQAAIRSRDSAFEESLLTTFADEVFAAMAGVWVNNDPESVRGVLADALWEPLAAATTINKASSRNGPAAGGIWQLASLQLGHATLAGAHAGDWYDSAMFSFDVRLGEGAPPMAKDPWQEEWLFQRSVQPGGDPMALPDNCPNCGAPAAVDAAGACTRCHICIPVCTSGWLVTRIVSHNAFLQMQYDQMVDHCRQNPEQVQQMPAELRALMPADLLGPSPAAS